VVIDGGPWLLLEAESADTPLTQPWQAAKGEERPTEADLIRFAE
jgi:hypothetical protein